MTAGVDKVTLPPAQVAPLLVIVGCAGASVMTRFALDVAVAQLLPSVTTKLYVPAFALVTFEIVGLAAALLKLFGPVHA